MQDTDRSHLSEFDEVTGPYRIVLNVEANPANRHLMKHIIDRRRDLKLVTATTGQQAIDMARTLLPDVILMGIGFSEMEGCKFFAALRYNSKTRHLPVIALSSDAYPHQIERGLKAGFSCYVIKPYKLPDLMGAIDMALNTPVCCPETGRCLGS